MQAIKVIFLFSYFFDFLIAKALCVIYYVLIKDTFTYTYLLIFLKHLVIIDIMSVKPDFVLRFIILLAFKVFYSLQFLSIE